MFSASFCSLFLILSLEITGTNSSFEPVTLSPLMSFDEDAGSLFRGEGTLKSFGGRSSSAIILRYYTLSLFKDERICIIWCKILYMMFRQLLPPQLQQFAEVIHLALNKFRRILIHQNTPCFRFHLVVIPQ